MLDELDLQLAGRIPRELHVPLRDAIVQIALAFANVKDELLPLLEAQLPETLPEPVDGSHIRTALQDDSDAIDASLLRFGGAWSGEKTDRHSAEERSSSGHRISVGPASSSASG